MLFSLGVVMPFVIAVLTLIGVLVLESSQYSDGSKYRAAMAECERTLPRDKHCHVIGVIDQEK